MQQSRQTSGDELEKALQKETNLLKQIDELHLQLQQLQLPKPTVSHPAQRPAQSTAFDLEQTLAQDNDAIPLSSSAHCDISMLELNQLRRNLRQREGEAKTLQHQLRAVESSKKAIAEELFKISQRNAELESMARAQEKIVSERDKLSQRHDILLELLGEKEEQMEELETEFEEVKRMFQAQLDALTRT